MNRWEPGSYWIYLYILVAGAYLYSFIVSQDIKDLVIVFMSITIATYIFNYREVIDEFRNTKNK